MQSLLAYLAHTNLEMEVPAAINFYMPSARFISAHMRANDKRQMLFFMQGAPRVSNKEISIIHRASQQLTIPSKEPLINRLLLGTQLKY